ncbi:porin [Paludisphaera borealis]|uniref:Porin O n=1 Tax=Paludisphaera borealis TaxID=1387353 RepID=A0A1U7CP00_9BACT|nr:porin [Paludisphaera borealis]APW60665.1 hypothetical protein BSF38_02152 [Paludisphaera borealis]
MPDGDTRKTLIGRRRPTKLASLLAIVLIAGRVSLAQEAPTAPPLPASSVSADSELLKELRELRREVKEAKADVGRLQGELSTIRAYQSTPAPPVQHAPEPSSPGYDLQEGTGQGRPEGKGETTDEDAGVGDFPVPLTQSFHDAKRKTGAGDNFPLKGSYRYNGKGTGALGGGGYFHIGDENDEFTLNLTNQITIDGAFFDRQNMPTSFQGFFVPFARTFLYGNITKDWKYQIGTQGFAGQFNLLDMWMSYSFGDWLTLRAGKGLSPPLYEYYAFSPALEPVITNSPVFQFAGKRQLGVMATGNLFNKRMQYWSGIGNSGTSFFYDLNRNVEYNGAVTFKPFENSTTALNGLGGGVGGSVGEQHYSLQQSNVSFLNGAGEPTTNSAFINASGVPFFTYNSNVSANGLRSRIAPHIFWFGRFSFLAEYMNFSRQLTDGVTSGRSTQRAFYVNASYFLTGERDFSGSGFQAYSTVTPLRPFIPSRGEWGPGAWQIAAQYAMVNTGTGDFARGFADPTTSTNRLDSVMVGLNWWPNKYTRLSFDYLWNGLNNAIPLNGPAPIDTFSTVWMRFAMFF